MQQSNSCTENQARFNHVHPQIVQMTEQRKRWYLIGPQYNLGLKPIEAMKKDQQFNVKFGMFVQARRRIGISSISGKEKSSDHEMVQLNSCGSSSNGYSHHEEQKSQTDTPSNSIKSSNARLNFGNQT